MSTGKSTMSLIEGPRWDGHVTLLLLHWMTDMGAGGYVMLLAGRPNQHDWHSEYLQMAVNAGNMPVLKVLLADVDDIPWQNAQVGWI
jgi:hypothetical protein